MLDICFGDVDRLHSLGQREAIAVREVVAVLSGAAGCLVLLYLLTYSPRLHPIEMLWRQSPREVTHCEPFAGIDATCTFFDRYNRKLDGVRSIIRIGIHMTSIVLLRGSSLWG